MLVQATASEGSSAGGPSFWAIAGPAIALAAIGVSVFLWWRGRERKALAYDVTETQLVRPEVKGRMDISYEGKPVSDPHLVEVVISNEGNAPLRREDFETALQIRFGSRARLLSADVTAVEPEGLEPAMELREDSLEIKPLLLNQRDGFNVQVLLSDAPTEVALVGRIAGVKDFRGSRSTAADKLVRTTLRLSVPLLGLALERETPARR